MERSSAVCQQCSVGVFALIEKSLDSAYGPFHLSVTLWVVRATCYMLKLVPFVNSWLARQEYWGSLSEKTISGMPCLAKMLLVCVITSVAVGVFSGAISIYEE